MASGIFIFTLTNDVSLGEKKAVILLYIDSKLIKTLNYNI